MKEHILIDAVLPCSSPNISILLDEKWIAMDVSKAERLAAAWKKVR